MSSTQEIIDNFAKETGLQNLNLTLTTDPNSQYVRLVGVVNLGFDKLSIRDVLIEKLDLIKNDILNSKIGTQLEFNLDDTRNDVV